VAAAELRRPADSSLLYPEEAASIARAVPKRAAEFTAGRLCARRALAEFGIDGVALTMGLDRAPVWPVSMVGSITHTEGFCAAAVAERGRFSSLGLDVEAAGAVKRELWDHICTPAELAWLESLPVPARGAAATLVFSAKEAFYKCQFPITGERLDFFAVSVGVSRWGGVSGVFQVSASPGTPASVCDGLPLEGRYLLHDEWLTAGIAWLP
jgi:4'-phosphopantetheinyl transferase EntD